MTKEEFTEHYTSSMSERMKEAVLSRMVALPCSCGLAGCRGWRMVRNNPGAIRVHKELFDKRPAI